MKSILDRFAPATSAFRPKTPSEFFAFRLAHKLGDATTAQHYVTLLGQYSESHFLIAFRRTFKARPRSDLGRRFHVELRNVHANGFGSNGAEKLLALRIERRSVAAAIFQGDHLEYTQVRQLSSAKDKALGSAVGFINWITDHLPVDSATVEAIEIGEEFQRRTLHEAIMQTLRDRVLPAWMVSKKDLFAAYGYPPLKSRKELREVISMMWPVLAGANGKTFIQDAAALGLYVQTERHFIIN